MSVRGSCLCASVVYEVEKIEELGHCHCSYCQKWHGAAFGTYADIDSESFRWIKGADKVARYQSSTHSARHFCRQCGSPLIAEINGKFAAVTLASVDDPPKLHTGWHMFVRSKVPWYEIHDGLPQYEKYPPSMDPPPES